MIALVLAFLAARAAVPCLPAVDPGAALRCGLAEPVARVEYFLVERPAPVTEETPLGIEAVAAVALRRLDHADGHLLERDVQFRRDGVRVLLDELIGIDLPRAVWRELRTATDVGRTWMVEWDFARGVLRTQRWGTRAPVHGRLAVEAGVVFPLAMLEALRASPLLPREVVTLNPLDESQVRLRVSSFPLDLRELDGTVDMLRSLAPVALARCLPSALPLTHGFRSPLPTWIAPFAAGQTGDIRTIQLAREDGGVHRRYVFAGRSLVAFQWQDGSAWARRVEEAVHRELSAEWRVNHDPVAELRRALNAGRVQRR